MNNEIIEYQRCHEFNAPDTLFSNVKRQKRGQQYWPLLTDKNTSDTPCNSWASERQNQDFVHWTVIIITFQILYPYEPRFEGCSSFTWVYRHAVSYTHLDVYKRQL